MAGNTAGGGLLKTELLNKGGVSQVELLGGVKGRS